MFKVTFRFENGSAVEAFAAEGENLLEVARKTNVAIDAPCSGNAACGKCRVKLLKGELDSQQTLHITDEEYAQGWRLSCVSKVIADVEVEVPDIASAYKSRMKVADLDSAKEIEIFERTKADVEEAGIVFKNDMDVIRVTMNEPTLDDTMPDLERLTWAVEKVCGTEANYVLASEAASAGCIVMSRTQEASEEEQQNTITHLNRALEHAKCSRRLELEHVVRKSWEELTDADFEEIASVGYEHASYVKQDYSEHGGFESLFFMNLGMEEKALLQAVQEIFSNHACGTVFRVKGFFKDGADTWKELNMTRRRQSVQPIARGQEVLIAIGEHLDRARIAAYFEPMEKR